MATTTINLSSLDGMDSFRLDGSAKYDRSGMPVSNAGDFNGDGFDDLVVGDPQADQDSNYDNNVGSSYVVFGKKSSDFDATLNLSDLIMESTVSG